MEDRGHKDNPGRINEIIISRPLSSFASGASAFVVKILRRDREYAGRGKFAQGAEVNRIDPKEYLCFLLNPVCLLWLPLRRQPAQFMSLIERSKCRKHVYQAVM